MTKSEVALLLAQARQRSGMTQEELAKVMGTTQPSIARAESAYRMPKLEFIDRWARATGSPITLTVGELQPRLPGQAAKRTMVRSVLGPGRFNPWDRNPSAVEAALLERAGFTRKHFERLRTTGGRRRKARTAAR